MLYKRVSKYKMCIIKVMLTKLALSKGLRYLFYSLLCCRYRGKVTSIEPELKVFYIDFGNEEVCSPDQVKTLPPSIKDIPALVTVSLLSKSFVTGIRA